jgi:hypothetical protein
LAKDRFKNSRNATSVQNLFRKLRSIFNDIRTFSESHSLDFKSPDTEELLRHLTKQLNGLRAGGADLKINAWQLVVFVRNTNWYHWMRARYVAV